MLTNEDIHWPPQKPRDAVISLAFGFDGEIVHTLTTYVYFYNLITDAKNIVCKTETCDVVEFLNSEGAVIETLQTTPLLGSILASSPAVFVLVRRSEDNSKVVDEGKHPWYRKVEPGWKYDERGILPL